MRKVKILKLNDAVALFNYKSVDMSTFMKMMRNKNAINDAAEIIQKQLKNLSDSLKPEMFDDLQKQLMTLLENKSNFDSDEMRYLQLRISLLKGEWDMKLEEANRELMQEALPLKLEKITEAEFEKLKMEKQEVVQIEDNKRTIATTNNFTTESLSALSPLLESITEETEVVDLTPENSGKQTGKKK